MPGSRAAELTYLKYRKVKRYIDSPASSSEAALLGLPVYAIYFDISVLTSTVRDHLYAIFTEESQPIQAEHTVSSNTEPVPKMLAPDLPSIFEIPVINLQDRYSFF